MPNSNPVILTTTNFSGLFREIYDTLNPGTGNGNVGKVFQVGSNGKVTLGTMPAGTDAVKEILDALNASGQSVPQNQTDLQNAITGKATTAANNAISTAIASGGTIKTAIDNATTGMLTTTNFATEEKTTIDGWATTQANNAITSAVGTSGTIKNAIDNAVTTAAKATSGSDLASVLGFSKGNNNNLAQADGTALSVKSLPVTSVKGYIDANDQVINDQLGTITSTDQTKLKANLGITGNNDVSIWDALLTISNKLNSSTALQSSDFPTPTSS